MADLASSASELVTSILDMPGHFVNVATNDPLSAVLIAIGALLVALPSAAFAYLALGGFLSFFTVEGSRQPPRQAR